MPQGLKDTVLPGLGDKLENAAQQPPGPAAQATAAETGDEVK